MTKNSISLLQRVTKKNLKLEPYPFIIINNALPESIYNQLEKEYISNESLKNFWNIKSFENNKRYQIENKLQWALDNNIYSKLWVDFIKYHSSFEFVKEVFDIFGEDLIKKYHPSLNKRFKSLYKANVSYRDKDKKYDKTFLRSDVQPGINSPVTKTSSVIGPHVDNKKEIYAGLFYMKDDADNSVGGDLQIYKNKKFLKEGLVENFDRKRKINLSELELVESVPYSRNTFVLFINSNISVHGVSKRQVTSYNRRLVNIVLEKK